jgi:hypothetical protein
VAKAESPGSEPPGLFDSDRLRRSSVWSLTRRRAQLGDKRRALPNFHARQPQQMLRVTQRLAIVREVDVSRRRQEARCLSRSKFGTESSALSARRLRSRNWNLCGYLRRRPAAAGLARVISGGKAVDARHMLGKAKVPKRARQP